MENMEYYYNADEIFCTYCNNLSIITPNINGDLEYVCRSCGQIRLILYCPYSHKLCILHGSEYKCPNYGKCKCTHETNVYTSKFTIDNSKDISYKFPYNLKYDNTYYRTRKIACECTPTGKNPEHIIYMSNPKTIDKVFICTNCSITKEE
jgi:hypothetical protein